MEILGDILKKENDLQDKINNLQLQYQETSLKFKSLMDSNVNSTETKKETKVLTEINEEKPLNFEFAQKEDYLSKNKDYLEYMAKMNKLQENSNLKFPDNNNINPYTQTPTPNPYNYNMYPYSNFPYPNQPNQQTTPPSNQLPPPPNYFNNYPPYPYYGAPPNPFFMNNYPNPMNQNSNRSLGNENDNLKAQQNFNLDELLKKNGNQASNFAGNDKNAQNLQNLQNLQNMQNKGNLGIFQGFPNYPFLNFKEK